MFNSKKGDFGVGLLIVVIGLIFVLGGVLYFFFVFKAHATLEARDEYIWNKVQEVPLDLLTTDIDNESLVSRINKVYYFGGSTERDLIKNEVYDIVSKQLFYFLEETTVYPFEAVINVGNIKITKYLEGCGCYSHDGGLYKTYKCSGGCGGREEEECYKETLYDHMGPYTSNHLWCRGKDLTTKQYYTAKYPFPLTFNGTDKFVSELSYNAIEVK